MVAAKAGVVPLSQQQVVATAKAVRVSQQEAVVAEAVPISQPEAVVAEAVPISQPEVVAAEAVPTRGLAVRHREMAAAVASAPQ